MRKVRISNVEDPEKKPHADIVVHRPGGITETIKPGRDGVFEVSSDMEALIVADRVLPEAPQPDPVPDLTDEQRAEMTEHNRRVEAWMQHGIRMGFPDVPEDWFPPLDPDGKPASDAAPADSPQWTDEELEAMKAQQPDAAEAINHLPPLATEDATDPLDHDGDGKKGGSKPKARKS